MRKALAYYAAALIFTLKCVKTYASGANPIKTFLLPNFTNARNKLECLSMASLSGNVGAYPS